MNTSQLNTKLYIDSSFEIIRKKAQLLKIDAMPNIAKRTKLVERLCWITLLLCSSSACVFIFVGSIREYLKYEVTTTNRIHQDRHVTYPIISICPINPFNTNYSVRMSIEANLPSNLTNTYLSNLTFDSDYALLMINFEKYV